MSLLWLKTIWNSFARVFPSVWRLIRWRAAMKRRLQIVTCNLQCSYRKNVKIFCCSFTSSSSLCVTSCPCHTNTQKYWKHIKDQFFLLKILLALKIETLSQTTNFISLKQWCPIRLPLIIYNLHLVWGHGKSFEFKISSFFKNLEIILYWMWRKIPAA